jgi:hypothetical protein
MTEILSDDEGRWFARSREKHPGAIKCRPIHLRGNFRQRRRFAGKMKSPWKAKENAILADIKRPLSFSVIGPERQQIKTM